MSDTVPAKTADQPQPLTAEDVGKIVADAIAGFTKKTLPGLLAKAVPTPKAGPEVEPAEDEPAPKPVAAEASDLRKMQKRLEKVEKENAEMRTATVKAQQDVERTERHSLIRTELAKHKVVKPDLAFKALK